MTDQNIFKNLKQEDPLTITFTLSPADHIYANTLRRAVLTEVETVGFRSDIQENGSTTHVMIEKNNTPMTNEMLADRIGLLPIFADPKEWKDKKYDERYSFRLAKKSESEKSTDVFASDFEVYEKKDGEDVLVSGGNKQFFHSDPYMLKKFPSGNFTPLITTLKGVQANQVPQEIKLVAAATVGKGRDHVRFSPVSQCSFKNTIDKDEARQKEFFDRWLISTKKINPSEVKDERGEMLRREFNTMEVERCFLTDENDLPYSYDFTIESRGQLPSPVIVSRALEALIDKCKKYSGIDKGDLPENVSIQPADWTGIGFDFIFQEEDYTLGYMLQTWMEANLMPDSKGNNGKITFVAPKIPHPLRDELYIRIGFSSKQDKEKSSMIAARSVLAEAARGCMLMFQNWLVMWNAAVEGKPVGKELVTAAAAVSAPRRKLKVAGVGAAAAGLPDLSKATVSKQ